MSKQLKDEKLKELEDIESYEELMEECREIDEEAYEYDQDRRNLYTYKIWNLIKDGSVNKDEVISELFEYMSGEDIGFVYGRLERQLKTAKTFKDQVQDDMYKTHIDLKNKRSKSNE